MSESHLPEDPASWPEDPFELLDVQHGVDKTSLKRAYTRLIRLYKPEHHPDEFRRLRDAYERLQRISAFYEWEGTVRRAPSDDAKPASGGAASDDESDNEEICPYKRTGGGFEDQIDAAWDLACQGEAFAAYRQLRELQRMHSLRCETYPRLYWLLKLHPEIDPAQSRNDWLVAGMRQGGPEANSLVELYRRELADDPREALTPRCQGLIEALEPAGRFADIVEARWQAAVRLAAWELIRRDLESCWQRLGLDDRTVWLRLQMAAVQQLAWTTDERAQRLLQVCCHQVEKFDGLQSGHFDELARIDFLLDLAAGWRALSRQHNPPSELLDLVRLSWSKSVWDLRPRLLSWLEESLRNPTGFLLLLDRVAASAPAVTVQFQRVLESLDREDEEDRAAEQGRRVLVADFLVSANSNWQRHEQYRTAVLQFCLQEFVQPQEVALLLATGRGATQPELQAAAAIQNDLPLRCLCLAHRVFWQQC